MSGIFGIYNRNGKSVEKDIAITMLDAMSYWDPDERDVWIDGPVALGHTMLWNTPESKHEHLPLQENVYVLTMDARIDNRDELAKEIELPDRPLSEIGDSEFILGAYKKWGKECPKHLLGDFSFAIWDEKKYQLFCARDHVGVKQFYYHLSDELFLFGNDLKGLTKYPDISQTINDEAVANYIVNHQLLSNTITFFETFKKLPPAHTLIVTKTTIEEKCYWRLEDAPKVKLPNAEAYAKKLRELLEEAVYARMRSDYPITSHLSGGLDSSPIASIVSRKLKEKGEKLLGFNWVHEPTQNDDITNFEWKNSRILSETEDIEHYYSSLSIDDIYNFSINRKVKYGDTSIFWNENINRTIAEKHGSRTIISGWGGDEFISHHGYSFYTDVLLKGKFLMFLREFKKNINKKSIIRSSLSIMYHKIFLFLIPYKIFCLLRKSRCPKKIFNYVQKDFYSLIQKELKKPNKLTMQPAITIRKHMLSFWREEHLQGRIESWTVASIDNRLEYVYPLLDKKIIEFAMGLPAECFYHNGIGRYLFRLVAQDIIPKELAWQIPKSELNRVTHILPIAIEASKSAIERCTLNNKRSNYIDFKKVIETYQGSENLTIDDQVHLFDMTSISIAISLIEGDAYHKQVFMKL